METGSRDVDYLFKSETKATSELANRSQVQIKDASTWPLKCEAVLAHSLNYCLQIISTAMANMASRPELPYAQLAWIHLYPYMNKIQILTVLCKMLQKKKRKAGCAEMYSAVFSSPNS